VDTSPSNELAEASAGSTVGSSGESSGPILAEPRSVSQAASEPDPEKAVKWYKKAAKNGSPAGQAALGEAYRVGMGVDQNDVAAYMWYTLAADQGSQAAADARALVAERMKPKQIAKAEAKAREWKSDNSDKMRLQTSSTHN
jgi:TPR repeat protein